MDELKANVLAIEMDGLVWGASTLVAVGFGIKKLQINLVVEDEKVSLEDLQEKIAEDEDHVLSEHDRRRHARGRPFARLHPVGHGFTRPRRRGEQVHGVIQHVTVRHQSRAEIEVDRGRQ